MRIVDRSVYVGPSLYARFPVIRLELDLGALEAWPTGRLGYVIYLLKAVWPSRLAVLYPYPHALPVWKAVASAVILAAITFLVVRYREHRYLPVGWPTPD